MPLCSICKEDLPVELMTKNKSRANGCGSYCKKCDNIRKKKWISKNRKRHNSNILKAKNKWRKENPDKELEQRERADLNRKLKKFNLTKEEYLNLKDSCKNKCMICHKTQDKELAIDHCHETGTVRGLLCSNCNTSLGLVYESIDTLKSMIKYLEKN